MTAEKVSEYSARVEFGDGSVVEVVADSADEFAERLTEVVSERAGSPGSATVSMTGTVPVELPGHDETPR